MSKNGSSSNSGTGKSSGINDKNNFLKNIFSKIQYYTLKKIFLPVFFIVVQNLYSIDISITGKELDFYFTPEYNRVYNFCWDLSTSGSAKINELYIIKTGLALGAAGNNFEIKGFAGGEAALPVPIPLYFNLAYNYNSIPEYEYHVHSIPLLIYWKAKRVNAALGTNFRLTSLFGEPVIFEPVISYLFYINIINNDILLLGLKITNFNDFIYGNFGASFLNLNTIVRLNKRFSLVNEIELHQSVGFSMLSNFYGFVYRGGVIISW